jgi:hypothetical protein
MASAFANLTASLAAKRKGHSDSKDKDKDKDKDKGSETKDVKGVEPKDLRGNRPMAVGLPPASPRKPPETESSEPKARFATNVETKTEPRRSVQLGSEITTGRAAAAGATGGSQISPRFADVLKDPKPEPPRPTARFDNTNEERTTTSEKRKELTHVKSLDKLQRMQIDLNKKREMRRFQNDELTSSDQSNSNSSITTESTVRTPLTARSTSGSTQEDVAVSSPLSARGSSTSSFTESPNSSTDSLITPSSTQPSTTTSSAPPSSNDELPDFLTKKYKDSVAEGGSRVKPTPVKSLNKLQQMQLEV